MIVGLVALLILGGAFAVVLAASGGSGGGDVAGASVRTEPISTANDPFAPAGSVGTDQTVPSVQTNGTVTVQGGHVGLYGGTLDQATCDKNQLVTYLQQNPDKGAAWASVLGISPADIPSYVATLTPVILRSDTFVTNHGFANGRATSIPAVLQAGTAVLVDDKGVPVTKCYCGNPLTPPPTYSSPPRYYGPTWTGFSPTNITIIQQNVTIITIFTLVDPRTGQSFTVPAGANTTATTTTAPTALPTQPRPAIPGCPPGVDCKSPSGFAPPPPYVPPTEAPTQATEPPTEPPPYDPCDPDGDGDYGEPGEPDEYHVPDNCFSL